MNWRSPSSIDLPSSFQSLKASATAMKAGDDLVVTDIWFRNPTRAIRAGSAASITFKQYAAKAVIASEAKQSMTKSEVWIASSQVLLAMTDANAAPRPDTTSTVTPR